MAKDEFSWTELDDHFAGASWNPFVGCDKISDGCKNCYAMKESFDQEKNGTPAYQGVTRKLNGRVTFTGVINRQDSQFENPRKTKKPHIFFLNSMSDFFHPDALDEWRIEAIEIMRDCERHLFEIVTKRTDEAIEFFKRNPIVTLPDNVWLGVTVESDQYVHRIDELTSIPAKVHFLAIEPLISALPNLNLNNIDWVIVGGENEEDKDRRRAMEYDWVIDIQQQCKTAGVHFMFKQWGHWKNNPIAKAKPLGRMGRDAVEKKDTLKKGGKLLDGQTWKDFPSLDYIKNPMPSSLFQKKQT